MKGSLNMSANINEDAIKHRRLQTWLQTISGFVVLGLFATAAFWATGFTFRFQLGFWVLFPLISVLGWFFSDKIALSMAKATPIDAGSAEGARVLRIVDGLFPKTGLTHKPPVYFAPTPIPNAFATGPFPARAVIAVTAGLLSPELGLSDEEIEGVIAHELSHVKNGDVGINSLFGVLTTLTFQIFAVIVDGWVQVILRAKSAFGLGEKKALPPFVGTILSNAIFYVAQQIIRILQLFVVRSRESGADALGAEFTKNPCALATGLFKLGRYVQAHRPTGRDAAFADAMSHVTIVDPLFDSNEPRSTTLPSTVWGRLKKIWDDLHLDHPPIPERIAELEKMNGGACQMPA
jgi:heat shock protein HtpX